jgi:hypothetical protein
MKGSSLMQNFFKFTILIYICFQFIWAQTPQSNHHLSGMIKPQGQSIPMLENLVESFYIASSLEQMESILNQMLEHYAQNPMYFELDSLYQHLKGNQSKSIDSLLKNISADQTIDTKISLIRLSQYQWNDKDRIKIITVLDSIAKTHPESSVKAFSHWLRIHDAHLRHDQGSLMRAKEELGPLLTFSLIGTWDNYLGMGFHQEYPPETKIDFDANYQVKSIQNHWRDNDPLDITGKLNLKELFYPREWQVAYALSNLMIEKDLKAKLLISSSDPVKIWVNQKEVLQAPSINGWLFDGIELEIELTAGLNQILIKSAQQKGEWLLVGRLTDLNAQPIVYQTINQNEYKKYDPIEKKPSISASKLIDESQLISQIQAKFNQKIYPIRSQIQQLQVIKALGLHVDHIHILERLHQKYPQSIYLQYQLSLSSWENQKKGEAFDLLNQLQKYAKDFPLFSILQAQFWLEHNLDDKAKDLIEKVIEKHPDLVDAYILLADILQRQNLKLIRCVLLDQFYEKHPNESVIRTLLIPCLKENKQEQKASMLNLLSKRLLPMTTDVLEEEYRDFVREKRWINALDVAQKYMDAWPQQQMAYDLLSEAYWYLGQYQNLFETINKWIMLNPFDPNTWQKKAEYHMLLGQKEEAIQSFEEGLKRNQDQQKIIDHLRYLKPQQKEPWFSDIPSESKIEEIIKLKDQIKIHPNVSVVNLLDERVVILKSDGSQVNIFTKVALAANLSGVDELNTVMIFNNIELKFAYAINPNGQRIESTSNSNSNKILFRQLEVGSVVVYQYEIKEKAQNYSFGHFFDRWNFQDLSAQNVLSRFIVWMDRNEVLHQKKTGDIQFTEKIQGNLKRVTWSMENVGPYEYELKSPPEDDHIYHVLISTVPDWQTFFNWEKELLVNAFRASPEIEELAKKLTEGLSSTQDKIYRIYQYVMQEIRYQQDYNEELELLKPHSASVVLSKKNGDCKDKAVLMISLLKEIGIKAEFALVLSAGFSHQIHLEIPSLQFNHVIVYIPAQDQIPEGRFYDPTESYLDLIALPPDEQGSLSLVFDPEKQSHSWIKIPIQSPDIEHSEFQFDLNLNHQGDIEGELNMSLQGTNAQSIRDKSLNVENFKDYMNYQLHRFLNDSYLVSNHLLTDPNDLLNPAKAKIVFQKNKWVDIEAKQFRLPYLMNWIPKLFELPTRKLDLILEQPNTKIWTTVLHLPDQTKVDFVPEDKKVDSQCITLERKISQVDTKTLKIKWSYVSRCERLSPEMYQQHLPLIQEMRKMMQQEVILSRNLLIKEK